MQTKYFKRVMAMILAVTGGAVAQQPAGVPAADQNAPPGVVASAVDAVEKLGRDVVRGDFKVAIDRMNPRWKEIQAKQARGGMKEIRERIEGASRRLAQEGVSIVSSVPMGQPRSFEVQPGKRMQKINGGEEIEVGVFTTWLVLVPTLTKYRLLIKGDPRPVFIEKTGFQVAVSDKDKNDWTFIDGSNLTVTALRRLYPTLPKDMDLPPIEERKAK